MAKKSAEKVLARQIGRQICRLRLAKGLTQFDLAEKAGIGISYISKIEQGIRFPSIKTSVRLAKALKVELAELFNFKARLLSKDHLSKEYLELTAILDMLSEEEVKLLLDLARKLSSPSEGK